VALIHLMRHGEPEGGKVFRGSQDDPLTAAGWQQMRKQAGDQQWDHIISSPLSRCLDFARYLQETTGADLTIEPGLQEIHFGDWEGCSAESLMASDSESLKLFWQDPVANPPPAGESMDVFRARVLAAWSQLCQSYNKDENVLVLCHGGVMRVIMQALLTLPWSSVFSIDLAYSAIIRIYCIDARVQWDALLAAPE